MHCLRRSSIVLLNAFREEATLKASCQITKVRLLKYYTTICNHNIQRKFSITEGPGMADFGSVCLPKLNVARRKHWVKHPLVFELQTVLSQIELILNSRLLGVLFDDELEQILTPNNLLFGQKLNLVNSSSTHPVKRNRYISTQSQEITWSVNLPSAIVYVIARLFR